MIPAGWWGLIDRVSTSLCEASTRIQATDPERRETPRVRTASPGLRVEPKWLPDSPDTPCSAETLTSGGRLPMLSGSVFLLACQLCGNPHVLRPRGGEGRMSSSDSPDRYPGGSSRTGLRCVAFS